MPRPEGNLGLKHGPAGWTIRPRMPDGSRPTIALRIPPNASVAKAEEAVAAWKKRDREKFERAFMEERTRRAAPPARGVSIDAPTVRSVGRAWTSGALLERYGRVEGLGRWSPPWARLVRDRLEAHVYPKIGDLEIERVTFDDIERVLRELPAGLAAKTREQYRSHLRTLFRLAVRPMRLRRDNPVDDASKPTLEIDQKDFAWIMPAELFALLADERIPLARRVLYAFAVYTGLRKGSLLTIRWADLDLGAGTLTVRKTKTGRPLFFALDAGLRELMAAFWKRCDRPKGDAPIFDAGALGWGPRRKCAAAEVLRADLKAAGVIRARLFERDATIEPLRFHDLRATFCTWARLAGRDDYWITSRTGHVTDEMMRRYTRAAKELAELSVRPFPPVANAIRGLDPEPPEGGYLDDTDEVPSLPPKATQNRPPRQESNLVQRASLTRA